jgi:hypothetical protein
MVANVEEAARTLLRLIADGAQAAQLPKATDRGAAKDSAGGSWR